MQEKRSPSGGGETRTHMSQKSLSDLYPTHKYHEKQQQLNVLSRLSMNNLKDFHKSAQSISYVSLPEMKMARLSHEELMIPLVYWSKPPLHHITAMCIQKSKRSGDIIITGSIHGELVIWRTLSNVCYQSDANEIPNGANAEKKEQEKVEDTKEGAKGPSSSLNEATIIRDSQQERLRKKETQTQRNMERWAPIAMSFSTNTSPVLWILGEFQHKEQASFLEPYKNITLQ
ncbi:hypothetical protein RFI_16947 [Reticulomyxa filosa]|uniref:Uncharacterized protein n=1 Tax=Reticulomyxa filosa TaxID=46433 RepID=X6N3D6_RETFI|nr:hypothetical protein RFI_16947 [Reticulomyxa filosa]|eukprot:ETO20269.1 hypothetical protein RFI_16947 [Reticulomyxa filosa]